MEVAIKTSDSFRRFRVKSLSEVTDKVDVFYNPFSDHVHYFIADLDGANALDDVFKLCDHFRDYRHVHFFSGKKGFHFYLYIVPIPIRDAKVYYQGFINYLKNELELSSMDVGTSLRLAGGSGLIRVPNTLHSEGYYCVSIPCDLRDMDAIRKHAISPGNIYVHEGKIYDIRVHVGELPRNNTVTRQVFDVEVGEIEWVKEIVRPCVMESVLKPNPSHMERTYFVTELAILGLGENTIVDIISRLNWFDYQEKITRYHVSKIVAKVKAGRLVPPSCRTLQRLGVGCKKCEWNNWWLQQG